MPFSGSLVIWKSFAKEIHIGEGDEINSGTFLDLIVID